LATNLKGKRVLITSGPTWVPIDSVRVISNTATGETGILLANGFVQQGCQTTLLLGVASVRNLDSKVKLKRFQFFQDLSILLKKELLKDYDIIIQAAAISDFALEHVCKTKINSECKKLKLTLKPTAKIINCLRNLAPAAFLVGFKFEPGAEKKELIIKTHNLVKSAKLDLAVGNNFLRQKYQSYLVSPTKIAGPFLSKLAMARNLIKLIGREYARN